MSKCSCQTHTHAVNEVDLSDFEEKNLTDPAILNYKRALKALTSVIKSASQSADGKELPEEYWQDVSKLLKKAKLGISMLELGIDDDEPLSAPTSGGDDAEGDDAEGDDATKPDDKEGGDTEKKLAAIGLKKESLNEKAKSAAQQRLFGMVHAYQKGDLAKSDVNDSLWDKIKNIAKGISNDDAEDIAKTKHDDLPEKLPTSESNEILRKKLDEVKHLGTIIESNGFKVIGAEYFDVGFVMEIKDDDRTHMVAIGNEVTLEGNGYSFLLGKSTNFGLVGRKFNHLASKKDYELLKEYQEEPHQPVL